MTKPRFLCFLGLLVSASLALAAEERPRVPRDRGNDEFELRERVRQAAETTWFHGITAEIADREVGPAGVPHLLALLGDPDFPRRDNVVALLAFLDGPGVVRGLRDLLESPPASAEIPDEDRALLLAPQALGHAAGRGSAEALALLLEITAPGGEGGPLVTPVAAGWYTAALRDDLVRMSLRGLALSGTASARNRLREVADGTSIPVLRDTDLTVAAAEALRLAEEEPEEAPRRPAAGDAPAVSRSADARQFDRGPVAPPPVGLAQDTNSRGHESRLSYANHFDHTSPMTDARLDQLLEEASYRAATEEFGTDVSCCIRVVRQGNAQTFGSAGDGMDVIDDGAELTAVLTNPAGRVKVVRAINYCGGPGMNIIGCAFTPGNGIVLVRSAALAVESILWLHEYGHNTGLAHNPSSLFIMHASNSGAQNGISQSECDAIHSPPAQTQMTPQDIGTCHDDDLDRIASSMDNCPDDANPTQSDTDGDGVGDVCEVTATDGLINISTRGLVRTGHEVMIGGFIVNGTGSKQVLIRALGPSLVGRVSGELADPTLTLLSGQSVLRANDNWGESPDAAAIAATGLAPPHPAESAILVTLVPGSYTAVVRGVNDGTGVALFEVYDVGGSSSASLTNVSTRGRVEADPNVLIGGFEVGGTANRRILIRAIGPTLSGFQVSAALADPTLELLSGQTVLAQNDDWGNSPDASEITASGLAPPDPAESAIVVSLAPGTYTAVARGAGGSGVGLVDVFDLGPAPSILARPPAREVRRAPRPRGPGAERR